MTVDRTEGVIAWFARNSVAANLVLLTIVAAGLLTLVSGIKVEVFPEVEPELVTVSVVYPGATPAEVEEASAYGSRKPSRVSTASSGSRRRRPKAPARSPSRPCRKPTSRSSSTT
jgi:hypothetical protein